MAKLLRPGPEDVPGGNTAPERCPERTSGAPEPGYHALALERVVPDLCDRRTADGTGGQGLGKHLRSVPDLDVDPLRCEEHLAHPRGADAQVGLLPMKLLHELAIELLLRFDRPTVGIEDPKCQRLDDLVRGPAIAPARGVGPPAAGQRSGLSSGSCGGLRARRSPARKRAEPAFPLPVQRGSLRFHG